MFTGKEILMILLLLALGFGGLAAIANAVGKINDQVNKRNAYVAQCIKDGQYTAADCRELARAEYPL